MFTNDQNEHLRCSLDELKTEVASLEVPSEAQRDFLKDLKSSLVAHYGNSKVSLSEKKDIILNHLTEQGQLVFS